ncbi:MAG: type I glyceraldehyde-3-phosphate dehydrogenase, partial [Dehalococcoidia bacterium]
MVTRVGVNGFGRIGRLVTRATMDRYPEKLEIAAVNDLTDAKTNAHLFKYDTNYGVYPGQVEANNGDLMIDGRSVKVFSERDPAAIPWSEMGVDLVVESTGIFTDGEQAAGHMKGGASKVIISAPASNVDLTMVIGVNDHLYDQAKHNIVSNASCTTNCFAPMVKVLHEAFGIEHGLMSTIHSYTNDQAILDQRHSDLRRARAAAMNIIPTSTGAARAVGVVLPELNGKL